RRPTIQVQRSIQNMRITLTDYLDVVSSWCFWSEPTWSELKKRYQGRVEFQWKIALMDPTGLPTSREQEQWFYRRSGMMMRSPFMLRTDWYDPTLKEWLAPNAVAEAAKEFGITDDRVRHTLAGAALRAGKKVSAWDVAAGLGAAEGTLLVGPNLAPLKSHKGTRFIVPASKCCLQLPLGSRLMKRALRGGHRSRGEAGCIGVVRK